MFLKIGSYLYQRAPIFYVSKDPSEGVGSGANTPSIC